MYAYKKNSLKSPNPPILRMMTRSGGLPLPTHNFNTRSNAARNNLTPTASRPPVPRADRSQYFTGSRPSFSSDVEEHFFSTPAEDGPPPLYCCRTDKHTTCNLPRRKDADQQQINSGLYATIGHIEQWQDYIANNCDPETITCASGSFVAYRLDDVKRLYNDLNNLELQSQHYNSQIAYHYSGDNPLTPAWVD